MGGDALPHFRYHPDPLGTGSVVASEDRCSVCADARGYSYDGPVYSEEWDEELICPWCIADGSAHERWDAEFTDQWGDEWDAVPLERREEVVQRTPGFSTWQTSFWLPHCGDACAFLGVVGWPQLRSLPDAQRALRTGNELVEWVQDDALWQEFMEGMDAEGESAAALFRCLHCATHVAYWDGA